MLLQYVSSGEAKYSDKILLFLYYRKVISQHDYADKRYKKLLVEFKRLVPSHLSHLLDARSVNNSGEILIYEPMSKTELDGLLTPYIEVYTNRKDYTWNFHKVYICGYKDMSREDQVYIYNYVYTVFHNINNTMNTSEGIIRFITSDDNRPIRNLPISRHDFFNISAVRLHEIISINRSINSYIHNKLCEGVCEVIPTLDVPTSFLSQNFLVVSGFRFEININTRFFNGASKNRDKNPFGHAMYIELDGDKILDIYIPFIPYLKVGFVKPSVDNLSRLYISNDNKHGDTFSLLSDKDILGDTFSLLSDKDILSDNISIIDKHQCPKNVRAWLTPETKGMFLFLKNSSYNGVDLMDIGIDRYNPPETIALQILNSGIVTSSMKYILQSLYVEYFKNKLSKESFLAIEPNLLK